MFFTKFTLLLLVLLVINIAKHDLNAQDIGKFSTKITYESKDRNLHYFVPETYTSDHSYSLVIALHGCAGSLAASNYRDRLTFLSDSIDAIIICPEGLGQGFMGNEIQFIYESLNHAFTNYNIDQTNVFLTGFSCNGFTTAYFGTHRDDLFKGIIPFDAALVEDDFTSNLFELQTKTSTCICIGSADPGLNINRRLRDSLENHEAKVYYNEIPGVGHTLEFPTFKEEMMECFHYINDNETDVEIESMNNSLIIYPNPASDILNLKKINLPNSTIEIFTLNGELILKENYAPFIDISKFINGTYLLKITNGKQIFTNIFIKRD